MQIEVMSPFPLQSLPRVWQWIQSFRTRVIDDYAPQTIDAFIDQAIADAVSGRLRTWAVYRDGELGGMVSFEPWTDHLGTAHCLFKREMWGRKTTRPALTQILQQIFAGSTRKLCMNVFSDNKAIIALLKELGAVTEAHYAAHTMRGGQLVDMTGLALFQKGFENASTSDSSGNRGRELHHRGRAQRPLENAHKHVDGDAHLVAGGCAAPGPAPQLLEQPDDGPVGRPGAH